MVQFTSVRISVLVCHCKLSDPPSSISVVTTANPIDLQAPVLGQVTIASAARAALDRREAAGVTDVDWLQASSTSSLRVGT
ncbi:unnamed protein product [Heligmosomoides polygyrus]|uniref:Thiolase_N domain-containing protein n=1 Tax=Heligmosomoides polygyrus TaxID=6339 RepID=A0A183F8T6_HELPZ|nr:unnamed protein product [Heligmosomoides polygyrus]